MEINIPSETLHGSPVPAALAPGKELLLTRCAECHLGDSCADHTQGSGYNWGAAAKAARGARGAERRNPGDPAVGLLGIYPEELTPHVHAKPCTRLFTAAPSRIARPWK